MRFFRPGLPLRETTPAKVEADSQNALRIRTGHVLRGRLCRAGFAFMAACAVWAVWAVPVFAQKPAPFLAALTACAGTVAGGVPLVAGLGAWTFEGVDGARYFAADLRPLPDRPKRGPARSDFLTGAAKLLALPVAAPNRWGLVPAWIVRRDRDEILLLQAELLRSGEALFAPDASRGECADRLRAAERAARRTRSGHWKGAAGITLLSTGEPETFADLDGHYVIASGRIVSLGKTAGTRYLNFGRYWKTDLTVTFRSSEENTFNAALGRNGHKVEDLAGQRVEVRGVLQERDGPYIALRHPEQLVVLEGKRVVSGGQDGN